MKLSGHLILVVQFSMVIGCIILSGGGSSIVLFFLGVMIVFAFLFVGPVHGAMSVSVFPMWVNEQLTFQTAHFEAT